MYNTPLPDLDNIGRWANNVKDQYYAQVPGRDVIANIAGFKNADMYWIFRDDLNPAEMDEFKGMVNSVLPWLGRATAQAWQVRQGWARYCSGGSELCYLMEVFDGII